MNPLAHSIAETCVLARAGRTAVYEAINTGKLVAHKRGARTIIFAGDLQRWLQSLPVIEAKHPEQCEAGSGTPQAKSRAPAERKDIS